MKKYILLLVVCFLPLFGCNNSFNNNIVSNDDNDYYINFKTYDKKHFYEIEKIRIENNFSYLEAINYFNYPSYFEINTSLYEAPFQKTRLVLVNKHFYLPKEYKNNNLKSIKSYDVKYIIRENETLFAQDILLDNYQKMYLDMSSVGLNIYIFSAYRDYQKQDTIYNDADDKTYVAIAGHSEHQTGLAIDISTLETGLTQDFENTKEFKWLYENSYKYGFILRYLKDHEYITGYSYEPWHFRYIGNDAYNIKNETTLEQYLFSNYEIL